MNPAPLLLAAVLAALALPPSPARAGEIIVIGDSWAEPIGEQLRIVLGENGLEEIPVHTTPYWGGPRNLDSPEGFAAISSWLERWPDATHLYLMMGQNNWLCCWDEGMIGTQAEADLFESIVGHMDKVVAHILSIRPDIRMVWTAGEYFRPHPKGTPRQLNANHDRLAALAAEYAEGAGAQLVFLAWNGHLQVTFGFNGVPYTDYDPKTPIPAGDPSLPDPNLPSPVTAYYNPAHPNPQGYKALAQALYDRYFAAEFDAEAFHINPGLNDAWYNPETAGQGFLITVFPVVGQVFLAWFTFDLDRPVGEYAQLGDPGHRWLTAQGPFAGNRAVLDIWVTEGGRFDSADPRPEPRLDGEIILEFDNCREGALSYHIPSVDRGRTIPIERITLDNVALCEALNLPPQK